MNPRRNVVPGLFQSDGIVPCGVAAALVFLFIAMLTNPSTQLAIVGALAAFLVGAAFVWNGASNRERQKWDGVLKTLPIPFALAAEPGFFGEYAKIAESMTKIVKHPDLLFLDLARDRVENIAGQVSLLAQGDIVFEGTETWRTAYQRVLETLRVKSYYSVAWVRTNDYWNDAPGRQSMKVNYDLIERGFRIERIHILPDELWPVEKKLPVGGILEWLVEQQGRGIHVSLVRESDLANEPDLLADFAIYGDRGIGTQQLDDHSQTLRFTLSFDQPKIRQALGRWERLALFSKSFQNLMDQ